MDRRDFLKWSAGLAALAFWACRKEPALGEDTLPARLPEGPVRLLPTALRARGIAHAVQVEVWGDVPIGVRGRVSAELLDLLPLFWMAERLPSPVLHGQPVEQQVAADWLRSRLPAAERPWLVAVPPVSSLGVSALLQHGAAQQIWEHKVVDGRADSPWNVFLSRMRAGEFAGMLLLGLHEECTDQPALRACWEAAPWRVAMSFARNRWTREAHLAWPAPHPFCAWDRHVLSDGSVEWQRPVAGPDSAAGWDLLMDVLHPDGWGRWVDWLESCVPGSVPAVTRSAAELEMPCSPWLQEARKSLLPLQGEPLLHLVPARPPHTNAGRRWGMVVDLDQCRACEVCALACALENNVPVVGDKEWKKGRGMHWIRVTQGIPLMCQHCAQAPCEAACPVRATTHSRDGLNEQTYARCIGSRYCAIHCPWKTRRFGYGVLQDQGGMQIAFNPRVPLRPQGVMEKCTFCVQRIRDAASGTAPVPACAEACPRSALIFGDWNDPASAVNRAITGRTLRRLASAGGDAPSVLYVGGA